MPSLRVNKELKDEIFFVTITVKNWIHFFDRYDRFKILEDCFVYCQKYKNLKIYAFVFMLNHLHFIGSAPDLGGVIRDMKKYLSKEFKKCIIKNEPRLLKKFINNKGKYSFWENTNCPKLVDSDVFYYQKANYIHYNPVEKGYVEYPEDWKWSSMGKISTKIELEEEWEVG